MANGKEDTERKQKIAHNEEVYVKMTKAGQGSMLGDGYVAHHVDRCRG